MKKTVFFDIDTQADFMSPKGRLYVKGARTIIPKIKALTACADKCAIPVVSSMDTHRTDDPEFKLFCAHCVKNTAGYKKIAQSLAKKTRQVMIAKGTFDIFSNPKAAQFASRYDRAYVYGVALDYCVKAACLGLRKLKVETFLVKDATKAVSAKGARAALALLKQKGVHCITTNQATRSLALCRKK